MIRGNVWDAGSGLDAEQGIATIDEITWPQKARRGVS